MHSVQQLWWVEFDQGCQGDGICCGVCVGSLGRQRFAPNDRLISEDLFVASAPVLGETKLHLLTLHTPQHVHNASRPILVLLLFGTAWYVVPIFHLIRLGAGICAMGDKFDSEAFFEDLKSDRPLSLRQVLSQHRINFPTDVSYGSDLPLAVFLYRLVGRELDLFDVGYL